MHPSDELQDAIVEDSGSRWFPPLLGIVAAAVGGALVIVGVIALMRAGVDGSLEQPIVHVAGLSHTALLGVVEVAAGVLVALAGLTDTRASVLLCATAMAVAGVVVLAQPGQLHRRLAVTATHGWLVIALAGVLVLAVLFSPETRPHERRVRTLERGDELG